MEVEWNHLYSLEVRAYNHVSVFYQYIRAGTLSYCVVIFVLARLLLRDCVLLYTGQFYHYSTTLLFTNWNLASLESAEQCLYQGFPHGFCIDENVMLTKTLNSLGILWRFLMFSIIILMRNHVLMLTKTHIKQVLW